MNKMVFTSGKRPDFSFIASLVIIVIVAFYLGMDFFEKSNISDYLEKTGNELFAKIVDQNERAIVQKSYTELLEKIEGQEISPEKVGRFAAAVINLKLAKDHLNTEELIVILRSTLHEAATGDSFAIMVESIDNERWLALNEKVQNIERFEAGLAEAQLESEVLNNLDALVYAIDDRLGIIADESYKGDLRKSHSTKHAAEIFLLEQEHRIKWSKNLKEHLSQEVEIIKKNIALLTLRENKLKIPTSTSSNLSQTFSITTHDSGNMIELRFNYNMIPEKKDSVLYTIPEIPDISVD